MRSVMLRMVSIWARVWAERAAGLQQQQVGVPQDRSKSVVEIVAHLEHVAAQSGLTLQGGAGKFGGAGAGFCAGHGELPRSGQHQDFEPILARDAESEMRGQRSWTNCAVAASRHTQKIGCAVECRGSRTTDSTSRRRSPTIATSKVSTAKRGHRSPLSRVNVGTLRLHLPTGGNPPREI